MLTLQQRTTLFANSIQREDASMESKVVLMHEVMNRMPLEQAIEMLTRVSLKFEQPEFFLEVSHPHPPHKSTSLILRS